MKNYLIKALGGYTEKEVLSVEKRWEETNTRLCNEIREKIAYRSFFLDVVQGKNRDSQGKFCARDSLKDYFAYCYSYGQMPHKKLTNAFIRYERSLSKVKSVKRTSEANNALEMQLSEEHDKIVQEQRVKNGGTIGYNPYQK